MIINKKILIVIVALILTSIIGVEAKSKKRQRETHSSEAALKVELEPLFNKRLTAIRRALQQDKLSNAIYFTKELEEKLMHYRTQKLDALFPLNTAGFNAEPYRNQARGIGLNGESFGVVLSKRYSNDEGHYIELLVVNDSEAISEYQLLIKRPNLITELQDAKLTQLQTYSAIEKWLPEQKIIEQNVVINTHLMINIFAKGVESPEVIKNFLEKIPFKEIESHLKN